MRAMSRLCVVMAIAVAWAGPAAAAKLDYEMHPGDLECPSASRFADEVTAKLGFSLTTALVHPPTGP